MEINGQNVFYLVVYRLVVVVNKTFTKDITLVFDTTTTLCSMGY